MEKQFLGLILFQKNIQVASSACVNIVAKVSVISRFFGNQEETAEKWTFPGQGFPRVLKDRPNCPDGRPVNCTDVCNGIKYTCPHMVKTGSFLISVCRSSSSSSSSVAQMAVGVVLDAVPLPHAHPGIQLSSPSGCLDDFHPVHRFVVRDSSLLPAP